MAERDITVEEVEHEHLGEVNPAAHAAYVVAVIGIGSLLMLVLIAILGASPS